MGSIAIHIAALLDGQPSLAENASIPQAGAASPALAVGEVPFVFPPDSQQDRVSLSGTLPSGQQPQAAPPSGNAQAAALAPLARQITFPAGQSTPDVFITSTFPAAATPAGPNSASAATATSLSSPDIASVTATSGAQTAAANAAATASPTSASSTAPAEQTLQQLDQKLQQLGIDPQSLSLISRGGMLNWINDPAALRQIVQNVRSAENSSQPTAAAGVAKPEQNAASSSAQPANSANTNAVNQSSATEGPNAAAVTQFQELQDSLAPRGIRQASPATTLVSTAPPQGQLLNVSA
jgi:hypothetical protein